jgi:hypothetical protein
MNIEKDDKYSKSPHTATRPGLRPVSARHAFETVVSNLLPYTTTLTALSCFPK